MIDYLRVFVQFEITALKAIFVWSLWQFITLKLNFVFNQPQNGFKALWLHVLSLVVDQILNLDKKKNFIWAKKEHLFVINSIRANMAFVAFVRRKEKANTDFFSIFDFIVLDSSFPW